VACHTTQAAPAWEQQTGSSAHRSASPVYSNATPKHNCYPFDTVGRYSEISPEGGDVDFYRFHANAGDILALEVVRGALDSTMGVFDADSGELHATNDDGGAGLLSRLLLQANVDLNLAVAVSAFPDLEFNGTGEDFGRYVLSVRKYRGTVVPAGDDTSTIVPFTGFNFPYQGTDWSSVFVNRSDGLVGITQDGGAADPGGTDLSRLPLLRKRGTTYQQFVSPDPVDLSWSSLFFFLP